MKVLINNDVFEISNRVKKFDSSYRVVYDNEKDKYQIYSTVLNGAIEIIGGIQLTYVCTLPYRELDKRSIDYLYATSINNIDDFIKQLDIDNKNLEHREQLKLKEEALVVAENKLRQLTK